MKKAFKTSFILLLFLIILPALAGLAVTALWNGIIPAVCGFAAITFWQGTGLFIMGQILTGGVLLALVLIGSGIHVIGHHHDGWQKHWHSMSDEQRREFIERRRRDHSGLRNRQNKSEDAAE